MKLIGKLDSLNFASKYLENLFIDEENYIIETVKGVGVFNPSYWLETFKSKLTRNIIEAKILYTSKGLEFHIKRFSVSQDRQTLEIAGITSYTNKDKDKSEFISEVIELAQDEVITRLDIAIDFKDKIPTRVIRNLKKNRKSFNWINSTYLKTKGEKKSNSHINIIIYPKHIKENLNDEIYRLEFSFRNSYFKKEFKIKDLEKAYEKMEKTITKFSGLKVAIKSV